MAGVRGPVLSEDLVQALSREAGVTLVYLRPIANGEAHVLEVQGVSNTEQLKAVMAKLSARNDVIYVEQDRRLRHQGN